MQPLIDERGAAKHLGLSTRTLQRLRVTGDGPAFAKLGASVRYRVADLETWVASRVVGSTSEEIKR